MFVLMLKYFWHKQITRRAYFHSKPNINIDPPPNHSLSIVFQANLPFSILSFNVSLCVCMCASVLEIFRAPVIWNISTCKMKFQKGLLKVLPYFEWEIKYKTINLAQLPFLERWAGDMCGVGRGVSGRRRETRWDLVREVDRYRWMEIY